MQPRGPLMKEHRVIERMVERLARELERVRTSNELDAGLVRTAVDFFRVYADRTHHGKEEEILFRGLDEKPLSAEDRAAMQDLVEEHRVGRRTVGELEAAADRYEAGDRDRGSQAAAEALSKLVDLYRRHIVKEDKSFFPAAMGHLDDEEQQAMLAEFDAFDRGMIHEKYEHVVEGVEGGAE